MTKKMTKEIKIETKIKKEEIGEIQRKKADLVEKEEKGENEREKIRQKISQKDQKIPLKRAIQKK